MREHWEPFKREPVSVHTPLISHSGDRYRHKDTEKRRMVPWAALRGVSIGAYDERVMRWLASWDVLTMVTVVSLLRRRARRAAIPQARRDGGEPR